MAPQVPYALDDPSVQAGADVFRRAVSALVVAEGILLPGDLAVSAQGTPNMTVNVGPGGAFILGDSRAGQGLYHAYNDGIEVVTLDPAHISLPRWDNVVFRIEDDAEDAGGQNRARIYAITGTPNASPVDPTVPITTIRLARITVQPANPGPGSVATANITDLRTLFRANSPGAAPRCRAIRSTSWPAPHNVATAVPFTSAPVNNRGGAPMWSAANPTRVTAPEAGLYHATGYCYFAPSAGGGRQFFRRKNGVTPLASTNDQGSSTWFTGGSIAEDPLELNAGDYLELMAFQNQTTVAPLNILTAAGDAYLGLRYVGPK